jgi:hypothetical protein
MEIEGTRATAKAREGAGAKGDGLAVKGALLGGIADNLGSKVHVGFCEGVEITLPLL